MSHELLVQNNSISLPSPFLFYYSKIISIIVSSNAFLVSCVKMLCESYGFFSPCFVSRIPCMQFTAYLCFLHVYLHVSRCTFLLNCFFFDKLISRIARKSQSTIFLHSSCNRINKTKELNMKEKKMNK